MPYFLHFSRSDELQQHITVMLCILAHTFHVILTTACKMIFYSIEVHMLINSPFLLALHCKAVLFPIIIKFV